MNISMRWARGYSTQYHLLDRKGICCAENGAYIMMAADVVQSYDDAISNTLVDGVDVEKGKGLK